MPAVTADTLKLTKIALPAVDAVERQVKSITNAPSSFEGEGFPVRRAFYGVHYSELDPFIMMDQMGEVEYAPGEPKGTPWHPHRGFETVTYLLDGTFLHQDSHGGGGVITDGATQWMTAGGGILHIETPPEELVMSGGLFHGIQLWVNLPAKEKMISPAYQNLEGGMVKLLSSDDGGTLLRVIAGNVGGEVGPGSTHTPITVIHATVSPGAQLTLPWESEFNSLVYVLNGDGYVSSARNPIHTGQLAVFTAGDFIVVGANESQESRSPNLDVMILGGQPIGEPVAQYGPFVMNTKEELMQAVDDFQAGRLGVIPENAIMPHTS